MKTPKRIKFICPRYLTAHAGGAEKHCLLVAEKCASAGYDVELLATTALNHSTWERAGEERAFTGNGLKIRLFHPNIRNNINIFHELESKIASGLELSLEEEKIWLENSVNSDSMYNYIKTHIATTDYFIFIPYLFGLTINGAKICPEKTILIPCLHEENFAYLKCIKNLFSSVSKIMFNSPVEMKFAEELYKLNGDKCSLVSLGFELNYTPDPKRFIKKYNIPGPYITFSGRRESGKNFDLLLEMFRLFNRIYPDKICFVTTGTPKLELMSTDRGRIFDLGFVSEEDKYDCFAGALFNCQPSTNESLSIIMMESWLCNAPVLVNKNCHVTSHWVDLSGGGFTFSDYFEFEQIIIYALENKYILKEMGFNGNFFVKNNFNWESILYRFHEALA